MMPCWVIWTVRNGVIFYNKTPNFAFMEGNTTPDLHITAGIITAGFVRTGSDVPSLPVMSLKMKK